MVKLRRLNISRTAIEEFCDELDYSRCVVAVGEATNWPITPQHTTDYDRQRQREGKELLARLASDGEVVLGLGKAWLRSVLIRHESQLVSGFLHITGLGG